eukprot:360618-Chlamydomonas_euryale.AAC.2
MCMRGADAADAVACGHLHGWLLACAARASAAASQWVSCSPEQLLSHAHCQAGTATLHAAPARPHHPCARRRRGCAVDPPSRLRTAGCESPAACAPPHGIDLARRCDDAEERIGLQRRAADQEAVHVLQRRQFVAILVVDGAAVKDAQLGRRLAANPRLEQLAQVRVHLLRLLRGCDDASADGPDWLVCHYDARPVLHLVHERRHLRLQYAEHRAALALLQRLADAGDDRHAERQRARRLGSDDFVRLAAHRAALRVAGQDPLDPQVQHRLAANLAGVRAGALKPKVLAADGELAAVDYRVDVPQVQEGGGYHHIDLGLIYAAGAAVQPIHQLLDARSRAVALPVAADEELSIAGGDDTQRATRRRRRSGARAAAA